MPYERVISTIGCAELELPECLELATRHGLHGIELRVLGGSPNLPKHLERRYGTPAALAQAVGAAGGRVVVLDTMLRLAGGSEADRMEFLKFVPWAEALGVRWLRVFDGDCATGRSGAGEAVETISWWRDLRRAHGWSVDCIVETHDSLFTAKEITRFVNAVPGIKFLWDAHHTWKWSGEDPVVTWQAIRSHVVHVHVKDSISRPNGSYPYTYVSPGEGEFPMVALARTLRAEFNGGVSLEWERLWHPYLVPLEDALRAASATQWW